MTSSLKPKRQRKRKSRTQGSPSSSDADPDERTKGETQTSTKVLKYVRADSVEYEPFLIPIAARRIKPDVTEFEIYYLKKATREFAEDLDLLRSKGDFEEGSLSIVVEALKQGASIFSTAEQERILAGRSMSS
ncbi:MAG: hypothetical protein M1817_004207 [Caeruleum heppii]|nr:MAG: hypothetical protein M1817_004207 [Caeruleum heppii]